MKQTIKLKVKLPESQEDISLDMYLKLDKLFKREDLDEYSIENRAIKIVTGLKYNHIEMMKQKDRVQILSIIQKALKTEESEFNPKFELNGITFGFIPNLDKIQAKEFFDIKKYESKPEQANRLMSVLYRPIVKDMGKLGYIIEEYKGTSKYSELMKQSPISAYKSAMVFFWTLANDLQVSTLQYIAERELARE